MTSRLEIFSDLIAGGISIHLDGNDLVLKPASRLDAGDLEILRGAKTDLIRILAGDSAPEVDPGDGPASPAVPFPITSIAD